MLHRETEDTSSRTAKFDICCLTFCDCTQDAPARPPSAFNLFKAKHLNAVMEAQKKMNPLAHLKMEVLVVQEKKGASAGELSFLALEPRD